MSERAYEMNEGLKTRMNGGLDGLVKGNLKFGKGTEGSKSSGEGTDVTG